MIKAIVYMVMSFVVIGTTYAQEEWTPIGPSSSFFTCVEATSQGIVVAGQSGRIFHYMNDTWRDISMSNAGKATQFQDVVGVAWNPPYTPLIAITSDTIYIHDEITTQDWTPVSWRHKSKNFNVIHAIGADMLIGADNGLYRSDDNGVTWKIVGGFPIGNVQAIALQDSIVLISVGSYIQRSNDYGITWTSVRQMIEPESVVDIAIHDTIAIAVSGTHMLLRSTDRGITWTSLGVQRGYDLSAVAVAAGNMVAASNVRSAIFHSSSGIGWSQSHGRTVYDFDTHADTLYRVCENGLALTTNGGNGWNHITLVDGNGLKTGFVRHQLVEHGKLYVAVDNVIHRTDDSGVTWTPLLKARGGSVIDCLYAHGQFIVVMSRYNTYISADTGRTWAATEVLPGHQASAPRTVIEHNGALLSGTFNANIQRSIDSGKTWQFVETHLDDMNDQYILKFAADNTYIYAATSAGPLLRSADDGLSWNNVGMLSQVRELHCVGDTLVVRERSELKYSVDHGTTWRNINTALPENKYVEVYADSYIDGNSLILAQKGAGIYVVALDGKTSYVDGSREIDSLYSITNISRQDDKLYVGTERRGVLWKKYPPTVTSIDVDAAMAEISIYPQPAHGAVTISGVSAKYDVTLISVEGTPVSVKAENLVDGIRLDVSACTPGMWLFQGFDMNGHVRRIAFIVY